MFHLGIRKKITYGFYLLLLLMVGSAVLTYALVKRVEDQVAFSEVIEDFFNTTLELRRFEKNYFLYRQAKDFQENQLYWGQIRDIYENNAAALHQVVSLPETQQLARVIDAYNRHMGQLHAYYQQIAQGADYAASGHTQEKLEEQLRSTGKELTEFGEKTRSAVKRKITTLLKTTQKILLASMLCLFVSALTIAALLGRKVVNSLKILEGYTKKISQGDFVDVAVGEGEEEIRSLLRAFNRMTRELQMRQHQLVQSEKLAALGTLLSGVAHELNNPLSNISTSAQILGEEIDEDNVEFKKSLIGQIEMQSDKARDIVRTLLEFSRIKEFKKEQLFFKKLVDETILLLRGHVPGEVVIGVDVPEDLSIVVDKQRMQQVLLNLIKNGIDAMQGSGHIWISALGTGCGTGLDEVEIIIEDDGPGIDAEHVNRIFDPFFTTKDVGKGSGLGLFIVHDIIEWHGGSISVDSRPGLGTTFIIWLPGEQQEHGHE
ncbi:MAG: HAMP domain-containing protein [Proteobacteria bacterium]|nr:HAMP domain-containing protein [Pseudomonadota bacterium]MBU1546477.1 HAMP domain-containing protein [Pseudomonadota bacterium]MBU2619995.1 HAMP domain-containing protein [Pseudomonadota bacterium]